MTLANAFTVAWKDLKTGAAKVADFLTKNSTTIKATVSEVGTVVSLIDPALAPVVTVFDQLEEQVVGKVLELANDTANANSLASLFGAAVARDPFVKAATLHSPGGAGCRRRYRRRYRCRCRDAKRQLNLPARSEQDARRLLRTGFGQRRV